MKNHVPLTEELATVILKHLEDGNFRQAACRAAGVPDRTVELWLRKARDAEAEGKSNQYTEFLDRMNEAEALAETRDVELLRDLGNGKRDKNGKASDWRAIAWILERRGAKNWGQKLQYEIIERRVSNAVDRTQEEFLKAAHEVLPEDLFERLLDRLGQEGAAVESKARAEKSKRSHAN